jgi:hypothetical protein
VGPVAWRVRHDAFALAVRALRLASPQGPQTEALGALAQALALHMAYEEKELWPEYSTVAPPDGPGSMRALLRDHRLIERHLGDCAATDSLERALALAKLEGVLDHHDQREGRYVLPALEVMGLRIGLDEPTIPLAGLCPCPPVPLRRGTVSELLRGLSLDAPIEVPPVPDHPKGARLHGRLLRALEQRTGTLEARRQACVAAFDALVMLSHVAQDS